MKSNYHLPRHTRLALTSAAQGIRPRKNLDQKVSPAPTKAPQLETTQGPTLDELRAAHAELERLKTRALRMDALEHATIGIIDNTAIWNAVANPRRTGIKTMIVIRCKGVAIQDT